MDKRSFIFLGLVVYFAVMLANLSTAFINRRFLPPNLPVANQNRPAQGLQAGAVNPSNPPVQNDACADDRKKLCADKFGLDAQRCLITSMDRLSAQCRQLSQAMERSWMVCDLDWRRLCSKTEFGGEKAMACLRENFQSLSLECKKRVQ